MEDDFLYRDESYQIIGCCMEVHKLLGCGFKEAVYQEALEMEFIENATLFEREKKLKIRYKGKWLRKRYSPDFVCFDKIVLELKAANELTNVHKSQLFNYSKVSDFKLGLLINFGTPSLQYKRFILIVLLLKLICVICVICGRAGVLCGFRRTANIAR